MASAAMLLAQVSESAAKASPGFGAIAALVLFIAASVWLGTLAQKVVERSHFIQGYFQGNRGLGPWTIALTATVQSGGTFMGFPSLVYTHGWIVALWIGTGIGGARRTLERALWCGVAAAYFLPVFDTLWKGNVSGLVALTSVAVALGGQRETLSGLAGLGDLVLTCTGTLSRNRHVGAELARGRLLPEILASTKMVAEGVRTTEAALALGAMHHIELPIAAQMSQLLAGRTDPATAIRELMGRRQKAEHA